MNNKQKVLTGISLLILGGIGIQFARQPATKRLSSPEARLRMREEFQAQVKKRDSILEVARQQKEDGELQAAAASYREALTVGLDLPEINREMGDMFLAKGSLNEAESAYNAGADAVMDPKHGYNRESIVLFRLAGLYARMNKPDLALKWLHTAMVTRHPDTNNSPFRQKNLPPDIIPELPNFRPVAEDMPKLQAFTHAQIGKDFGSSMRREDIQFTLSEYKTSVALDPDSPWQGETWSNLGRLSLEQGDGPAAKAAYQQGLVIAQRNGNTALADSCKRGLERLPYVLETIRHNQYKLAQIPTTP